MAQRGYLTTKEVAKILNLSIHTIYKYVRERKLVPVYEDNWQIDETLLFRPEDVEELKSEFKKPGLTTGEAAKHLGVHPTTISSYINQGTLKARKQMYRGRDIYFIRKEDLVGYKTENNQLRRKEQKSFYNQDSNLYLYQSLINKEDNCLARIIELENGEGKVLTEEGRIFPLSAISENGFIPKELFTEHDYITKRGYAEFRFNKPGHISSPIFNIIETFYREIGHRNIRMVEDDKVINIEVKPFFTESMRRETQPYEINILQQSLIEGFITLRHNGLLIESDLEPLNVYVPSKLKEQIVINAENNNQNITEYINAILKREIEGYKK